MLHVLIVHYQFSSTGMQQAQCQAGGDGLVHVAMTQGDDLMLGCTEGFHRS